MTITTTASAAPAAPILYMRMWVPIWAEHDADYAPWFVGHTDGAALSDARLLAVLTQGVAAGKIALGTVDSTDAFHDHLEASGYVAGTTWGDGTAFVAPLPLDPPVAANDAQWHTACPRCGGDLYVTHVTLVDTGQRNHPNTRLCGDGFEIPDSFTLSDASTENEQVLCRSCWKRFWLSDLAIDNDPATIRAIGERRWVRAGTKGGAE